MSVLRASISSIQSVIGLVAGVTSIVGALYSALQYVKPAPTVGEIVAVVRVAGTDQPVADATIEVLTPDNALVDTLTPTADGQARQTLREGLYRVRVAAPRFDAQARAIQVQPGGSAPIRFALAQHVDPPPPSPSAGRKAPLAAPVGKSMNAAQRFFHKLGF